MSNSNNNSNDPSLHHSTFICHGEVCLRQNDLQHLLRRKDIPSDALANYIKVKVLLANQSQYSGAFYLTSLPHCKQRFNVGDKKKVNMIRLIPPAFFTVPPSVIMVSLALAKEIAILCLTGRNTDGSGVANGCGVDLDRANELWNAFAANLVYPSIDIDAIESEDEGDDDDDDDDNDDGDDDEKLVVVDSSKRERKPRVIAEEPEPRRTKRKYVRRISNAPPPAPPPPHITSPPLPLPQKATTTTSVEKEKEDSAQVNEDQKKRKIDTTVASVQEKQAIHSHIPIKHLINKSDNVVNEFLEGILLVNNKVTRLPDHPNVLIRSDFNNPSNREKVAIITGGGSGHDPMHIHYIGPGMLTAVVAGNIFASPSVSSIYGAIDALKHHAGILLIVKNYAGDKINFGMASQKAISQGIANIKIIIVEDDCAVVTDNGRRGLAGTIFIHKIAGALSERKESLNVIFDVVTDAVRRLSTAGIATSICHLPGVTTETSRLADSSTIEVGLGIHGEPGLRTENITNSIRNDNLASHVAETLVNTIVRNFTIGQLSSKRTVVVMINNLGGTTDMELFIVARSIFSLLPNFNFNVSRVLVGKFCTALDMKAISLTIFDIENSSNSNNNIYNIANGDHKKFYLDLIDQEAETIAWNSGTVCIPTNQTAEKNSIENFSSPKKSTQIGLTNTPNKSNNNNNNNNNHQKLVPREALDILTAICNKILKLEKDLTYADTICGDGDCGLTFRKGCQHILKELDSLSLENYRVFFNSIADAISNSMGGTSGALLESMLRAIGKALPINREVKLTDWIEAYERGVEDMIQVGEAELGDRTMLDSLIPVLLVMKDLNSNSPFIKLPSFLQQLSITAAEGAKSTKDMVARKGRAAFIQVRKLDACDPGCLVISGIFEAIHSFFTRKL